LPTKLAKRDKQCITRAKPRYTPSILSLPSEVSPRQKYTCWRPMHRHAMQALRTVSRLKINSKSITCTSILASPDAFHIHQSKMAATQVYIEQLYKLGHGRPLWDPDSCEVYVGDVGFFERDSGSFCRLFNVLVGEGDALNNRGVPDNFVPLQVKSADVRHTMQPWTAGQCLKTQTVTSSEAEFHPLT
jgi:hypothetical protein